MDVEDWGVIERDADRPQFCRERCRKARGQRHIAAASEHRHRGPFGEGGPQACNATSLLIDTDPERQVCRERLEVMRELGDLLWRFDIPREQDDAAQLKLARERMQL